jgi:hypothetical protein
MLPSSIIVIRQRSRGLRPLMHSATYRKASELEVYRDRGSHAYGRATATCIVTEMKRKQIPPTLYISHRWGSGDRQSTNGRCIHTHIGGDAPPPTALVFTQALVANLSVRTRLRTALRPDRCRHIIPSGEKCKILFQQSRWRNFRDRQLSLRRSNVTGAATATTQCVFVSWLRVRRVG